MKLILQCTALAMVTLAGCSSSSKPHTAASPLQADSTEQSLWNRCREEQAVINRSGVLVEDPALEAYLEGICYRLWPELQGSPFEFSVRVLKDPRLNAFAYPNGAIYVHTGMLAAAENEAQIASVLGHELVHLQYRHAYNQFKRAKSQSAFFTLFDITVGGVTGIFTGLGSVGFAAAITGYSRESEREADEVGWKKLRRAGYATDQTARTYEILLEYTREQGEKEPFFFGSHPKLTERLEAARRMQAAQAAGSGAGAGFVGEREYMEKISAALLLNCQMDIDRRNYARVIAAIRRRDAILPPSGQSRFLLGEALHLAGDADLRQESYDSLQEAIRLDPDNADAHRSLGLLYFEDRRYDLAKPLLESALALAPDHPRAQFTSKYIDLCKQSPD